MKNYLIFGVIALIIFFFLYRRAGVSSSDQKFYDQRQLFPELGELKAKYQTIRKELGNIGSWMDWPEHNLYHHRPNQEWKVFPLFANNQWNAQNASTCPKTTAMLKKLKHLRTASFSRLGPKSQLKVHQGWGDHSNHVLRCHLGLRVPPNCLVWVDGETETHREGEWLVFDDSKKHSAMNPTNHDRIVLLVDLKRPSHIKPGTSQVERTPQLEGFLTQAGFA